MTRLRLTSLRVNGTAVLATLGVCLVLKTVASVMLSYADYFPPNFRAGFLLGREEHFFGWYQYAFAMHVTAGPVCLLTGLVLLSDRFRRRHLSWHRRIGRVHTLLVLLLVAPSGLLMAYHTQAGMVAGAGFASLAVATAVATAAGWRTAVRRRIDAHRHWMRRSYALLASAVVLRVMGGAAEVLQIEGTDPLAAWLCWLLPLAAVELTRLNVRPAPRPLPG